MTMHHLDVSRRFDVPADDQSHRSSDITPTNVVDPSICEWAIDPSDGSGPSTSRATIGSAAIGFVDFDALETVHLVSAAARRS